MHERQRAFEDIKKRSAMVVFADCATIEGAWGQTSRLDLR